MLHTIAIQKKWIESIRDYPDDVRLSFYEHIFNYAFSVEPKQTQENPNNPMGYMAFCMIKPFLDTSIDKYKALVERNRANGSKGGRPKETQQNQENPVGFLGTQENPNNPNEPTQTLNKNKNKNININIDSSLHSESYSIDKSTELLSASQIKEFVTYWNSKLPTLKISQFTETENQN
jgi:hypothetical protein